MSAPVPSRAAIEAAPALDFPQRTKADLTITVKATIDGFPTEVCFTGSIDQLLQVTKRLRELGASPTIAPMAKETLVTSAGPLRKSAQTVEPIYQPDGTACCPVHKKPLSEGRYGLFCPSKAQPGDAQNDKGYCSLKFSE